MKTDRLIAATQAGRILNRSAESVRAYERQGKLPAAIKTDRGVRLFREQDVEDLAKIMQSNRENRRVD